MNYARRGTCLGLSGGRAEGSRMTNYFNECLRAWAFAHSRHGTENALRLLQEMTDMEQVPHRTSDGQDSLMNCRPDTKTYEYVLTCLTRAPTSRAVKYARTIFGRMDESNIPISLSVLNTFLRVLSKSKADGALQEAEAILHRVEEKFLRGESSICPNRSSFEILFLGYMRSTYGLLNADQLLDHMKTLSQRTNDPELLPTPEMYRSMMAAWASSKTSDSMERVEQNIRNMAEQSNPTSEMYLALQEAWMESGRDDAARHVEGILVKMQQEYDQCSNHRSKPTLENFNIVIQSWASCIEPGSAERADAILQRLNDLYKSDNTKYRKFKAGVKSYEYALRGWSLSESPDAGERAVALLARMKDTAASDPSFPLPSQGCYNHALVAVGKSMSPMKADKCYSILEEMSQATASGKNINCRPTHDTFQTILQACSTCTSSDEEKIAAFRVLNRTMRAHVEQGRDAVRADAYMQYLYASFRLAPAGAERDKSVVTLLTIPEHSFPLSYLHKPAIVDALRKTVSLETFNHIVAQCS